MDLLGGLWHLSNFFGPAVGLGLFSALIAKLLWWRELSGAGWLRLWAWSSGMAALVCVGGLWWFGHDGQMATYAAMVAAGTLGLWWAGFGPGRQALS